MTDPTSELLAVVLEMEADTAKEPPHFVDGDTVLAWAARIRAAISPEREAFVARAIEYAKWKTESGVATWPHAPNDWPAGLQTDTQLCRAYRVYIAAEGKKS